MARVSGPVSGLPLPRKSRGRVRSVCVREGVNKHKCENTQSINTHPWERKTRHWLESGSPVPPPGLLHPLSGSQAVLPQPAAAEFSGLVQDCCNRTASWLTAAMPVLLNIPTMSPLGLKTPTSVPIGPIHLSWSFPAWTNSPSMPHSPRSDPVPCCLQPVGCAHTPLGFWESHWTEKQRRSFLFLSI